MTAALLLALLLQVGVPADSIAALPLAHDRFDDARAVEIDPFGALYVADAGRHVIVKMDSTGRLLERLGGPGSAEGLFDRPTDVDPTNGLVLLVADAGNGRIQIFSRAHAFLGSIPLTRGDRGDGGQISYRRRNPDPREAATGVPIAVVSFGSNEIAAVDADRGVVLQWNENRRFRRVVGDLDAGGGALGEPVSLWIGSESLLYVADRGRREIVVFDAFGSYVRAMGGGHLDRLVAVTGRRNEVYAVTEDAIVVFDRLGRRSDVIHPKIPEPIADVAVSREGTLYALTSTRLYRLAQH